MAHEHDFMIGINNWKTFEQRNPPSETPCWLKLENGSVVLAAYANNGKGSTGWWAVYFDNGEWKRSGNNAYIATKALWQPCLLFEM
jgi:hypothetical protein